MKLNYSDLEALIGLADDMALELKYSQALNQISIVEQLLLDDYSEQDRKRLRARCLYVRANIARDQSIIVGKEGAIHYFGLIAQLLEDSGDSRKYAGALIQLAYCQHIGGQDRDARQSISLALGASNSRKTMGAALRDMARLEERRGNLDAALNLLSNAVQLQRHSSVDRLSFSRTMQAAAYMNLKQDVTVAERMIDELESIPETFSTRYNSYRQLELKAALAFARQELDLVEDILIEAESTDVSRSVMRAQKRLSRMRTMLSMAQGKFISEQGGLRCILLGNDSTPESLQLLTKIKSLVESECECILIKQEPDIPGESLLSKVMRYSLMRPARTFVIYECSKPSGALTEIAVLAKDLPMARIRLAGRGDSYMVSEFTVTYRFIREFVYRSENELRETVNMAVAWCSQSLLRKAHEMMRLYHWQSADHQSRPDFLIK